MKQRVVGWLMLSTFPVAYALKPWIVTSTLIICPFRAITGHLCIFCGLTRAFAYATHGDFDAATAMHPAWWLMAAVVLVLGVRLAWRPSPLDVHPRLARLLIACVVFGSLLRAAAG